MIKSVTGAFLGSCDCAQDRFTEREVNVIINGRAGISGISWTNKSITTVGLFRSLNKQIYSAESESFTGLNSKLKFFGFKNRCNGKIWKITENLHPI